jgi:hypothetical protein
MIAITKFTKPKGVHFFLTSVLCPQSLTPFPRRAKLNPDSG